MEKHKHQFAQPNPTDADRTNQHPGSAPTPDTQHHTTANADDNRQGEGQQTNAPEGTLLDTALNSGLGATVSERIGRMHDGPLLQVKRIDREVGNNPG